MNTIETQPTISNSGTNDKDKEQNSKQKSAKIKNHRPNKLIIFFVLAALLLSFAFVGAYIFLRSDTEEQSPKPLTEIGAVAVKVLKIEPRGTDVTLRYVGSMQPKVMESVMYERISTISKMYVEAGQRVSKGDRIALVDTANAQRTVDAAQGELNAADAVVSRAQINYDYSVNELNMVRMENKKAQDKADLDNASLPAGATPIVPVLVDTAPYEHQVNLASTTLTEAHSQRASSASTYESAVAELNKCTLRAGMSGYVVLVIAKVGDLSTPMNPIAMIGSFESVAKFGASATDVHDLTLGMSCKINMSKKMHKGEITDISRIPDIDSRTYETVVSVPVEGETFLIGEIVNVEVNIGKKVGVWIPISVILNDGDDYVYVVENNRATRKNVKLSEIANNLVQVTGLDEGGLLVVEGMKTLKSGGQVTIVETAVN